MSKKNKKITKKKQGLILGIVAVVFVGLIAGVLLASRAGLFGGDSEEEADNVIRAVEQSERLLRATIAGDEEEVAEQIDLCHRENTSILNYHDENSLASCITLAYYTARNDYRIIREMPAGYGFADMVFVPLPGRDKPAMVVELKWNQKCETALDQIRDKKYVEALDGYKGEVLLVGISYEKRSESKEHVCKIERVELE